MEANTEQGKQLDVKADFSLATGRCYISRKDMKGTVTYTYHSCLDLERSLAVDAMALLGGNEYLVQQMIDRLSETDYRLAGCV